MTCADARHLILTADPAVLRERSDASLRAHLEVCAACASQASHIVADVDRLRAALIARGASRVAVQAPRRSRKRIVMTLVPVALAAELALFAFLSNRDAVNPILDRPAIDDSVTTMLRPAAHLDPDTGGVTPAPVKATKPRAMETVAQPDDSTTDADSSATPAPPVSMAPQLQVTPTSARQQIAVIGTSNPKITVVWITKGDSL